MSPRSSAAPPLLRQNHFLMPAAASLMLVDVFRIVLLPQQYQTIFIDGFETVVAASCAVSCAFAASRSSRLGKELWLLVTAYFAILAMADFHDFSLGMFPLIATRFSSTLEFFGWYTYLPLALLVFFPLGEEDRPRWNWTSVLDFLQVALVLTVSHFHLIYLPHIAAQQPWAIRGFPEDLRNVFLSAGLLLRAIVDPSLRARAFYWRVGGAFASVTFFQGVFQGVFAGTLDGVAILGRPASLLVLGIFAAHWEEIPDRRSYPEKRSIVPLWVFNVVPVLGPVLVLMLEQDTPVRYLNEMWFAVGVSIAIFIARVGSTEYRRQASDRLQNAFYRIAKETSYAADLRSACAAIHSVVRDLIDANNFYIVLYDSAKQELSFPYFIDEHDPEPGSRKIGKGLTEYVLRTGEPLLASPALCEDLRRNGQVEVVGTPAISWLGVPLKSGSMVFGVMVVQSYTGKLRYGKRGKAILALVAQHVANAIEHKTAEEELRKSFLYARNLIEASLDPLVTISMKGKIMDVNEATEKATGISRDGLIGSDFSDYFTEPEKARQGYKQVFAQGFVKDYQLVIRHTSGRLIDVLYNATVFKNEAGETVGAFAAARDITERKRAESALQHNEQRLKMLLEIKHALVSKLQPQDLFPAISSALHSVFKHDFASTALYDVENRTMRIHKLDSPLEDAGTEESEPVDECLPGQAFVAGEVMLFGHSDMAGSKSSQARRLADDGIQLLCCVPMKTPKGSLGTLCLGSRREDAFRSDDFYLMAQVATQVGIALDNARAYREIAQLKEKLVEEKLYLESELQSELHFDEIVGESLALKQILGQAKIVAATEATVLLMGETGTGKELVARAIHRMSPRSNNSFVKMNCAAIPSELLESELFGHEKGAFTGAVSQKAGRLELADNGTLFLDEIGEIPLALQPKLLRILQDQEFERLGGTRTIRVNIRLIAATNRDLIKSVTEGQFRRDLFYRLNVFPIRLPSLRERRTDISKLVAHFVEKYARQMNKRIESIPSKTLEALTSWDWPGNIRELENFIERSVILTPGPVLQAPLTELQLRAEVGTVSCDSLEVAEREHIIRILRECRGLIAGPNGAAARLGTKRTTLQSKLQRLGISLRDYRPVEHDEASST